MYDRVIKSMHLKKESFFRNTGSNPVFPYTEKCVSISFSHFVQKQKNNNQKTIMSRCMKYINVRYVT